MDVTQTKSGLLVATLSMWDGQKWQPLPLPQEWGPSPLATLLGLPIIWIKPGWRNKSYAEAFYARSQN